MIDAIRGMDFQTRHLRMALRTGHREHIARALLIESMFHATASNPTTRAAVHRARARDRRRPDDPYVRAMIAGARGAARTSAATSSRPRATRGGDRRCSGGRPGNNWESSSARLFQMFALRFIGDYVAMRAKYEEYMPTPRTAAIATSSRRCGALCVTTFWLAEDDARGAVRELERATWVPPAGRFHVQHFHELVAWSRDRPLPRRARRARAARRPVREARELDAAARREHSPPVQLPARPASRSRATFP